MAQAWRGSCPSVEQVTRLGSVQISWLRSELPVLLGALGGGWGCDNSCLLLFLLGLEKPPLDLEPTLHPAPLTLCLCHSQPSGG